MSEGAGFLFREMDRNAVRVIRGVAKPAEAVPMRQMETCRTMLFCGVPFYSIWHQIRFKYVGKKLNNFASLTSQNHLISVDPLPFRFFLPFQKQ